MKTNLHLPRIIFVLFTSVAVAGSQSTVFTYQGRLNDEGNPASGSYDFRFRLAADPQGNSYLGSPVLTNGVPVSGGLFRVKHLGSTAQDFQAAFGLGGDDKIIGTVDADAVALAAIQALNRKLEEHRAKSAELTRRLARLEQLFIKLVVPEE